MIQIWLFLFWDYVSSHLMIILAVLGVLLAVAVPVTIKLLESRSKRRSILKKHFKVVWKKSSKLYPKDLLELRPYYPAYHSRDEDKQILSSLSSRKNVLVLGPPLSGKTRAVYEALTQLNKPCDVLIAASVNIDPERFLFPRHIKFCRQKVLVIDDLHRFVENQSFDHLLREASENNTTVVATCRTGFECKKAKDVFTKRGLDFDTTFGKNVFELGKVTESVAEGVAKKAGIDWAEVKFDGNIGSVFMKLNEMQNRFAKCPPEEKTVLQALRKLYICGAYEEEQVFPLKWIKSVAKKDQLEGLNYQWNEWFEQLRTKEFVVRHKEALQAEEVYLQDVVKPEMEITDLELFNSMLSALAGLPYALVRLGNRAYSLGEIHLNKANYMKISITAYEEALKVYTLDRFPMDYGMTQNNLGITYRTLAEVEEKAPNCKRAITACKEALKVYTLDRFPMQYGITQNNLGYAYHGIAEVEDRAINCKRAIIACQEASKVYTLDRFPMQYSMIQINLGNAYNILAEVEDIAINCKRAITACQEALKVYTLNHFPMQYSMTQINLGNAYWTLAQSENKVENCKKAKSAFQEALKGYTKEELPLNYQMVQNNLKNLRKFCEGE